MAGFTLFRERKESFPLIKIVYGTKPPICVTTSKSPKFWEGNEYKPEPAVEIDIPENTGGLTEEPCKVSLPLTRGLHLELQEIALLLSKPRAAPKVTIHINNLFVANADEQEIEYLYEGQLDRVIRNPEGKKNSLDLEFQTEFRHQLKEISLGRRCDPECDLVFGSGTGCKAVIEDLSPANYYPNNTYAGGAKGHIRRMWVGGSFYSVQTSREVTLTLDPTMHPGGGGTFQLTLTRMPRNWWVGGFLEKDGVRIRIQEWKWNEDLNQGTNIFVLNRVPPEDWEGALLLLTPDCLRSLEACNQRNQGNVFGGLGYGIPAFNPTLEVANGE